MEKPEKLMLVYVSYLRFLYLLHQNAHWECKSLSSGYALHQLFERLYQEVAADLDQAAEKTIGLFSCKGVALSLQLPLIQDLCSKHQNLDMLGSCLEAEQGFIKTGEIIYSKLKQDNNLSLGLDDMIMSHMSNSESRIYLLKQSIK